MFNIGKGKMLQKISLKSLVIVSAILVATVTTTVCLFGFAMTKEVVIKDGGSVLEVTTTKKTVGEIFAEKGIVLRDEDRVSVPLDQKADNRDEIVIERAKQVSVYADGSVQQFFSCVDTVSELLSESGIAVNEEDEVIPALDSQLGENSSITVNRITAKYLDFEEEVPFETKRVAVPSKPKDYSKVTQEGQNGVKKVTYKNVFRNETEVSSEIASEEIITAPVEKIEEYGTQEEVKAASAGLNAQPSVSRGGLNYRKVLQVSATAYDASPASNGIYAGRTATGRVPTYGIVAVDPRVIPLNSRLYIESSDGGQSWVYGYAIAGDTGGAIKGNKIDLCFDSAAEVTQFGRRSATVYVLD